LTGTQTPWIEQLSATPRAERARLLETLVVDRFKTALLMTESEPVPLDESYFDLGLSSLGAVEIEQYLRATLGRAINTAEILNNPTLAHLLGYLRAEVLAEFFPGATAAGPDEATAAADAEDVAFRKAMLDGLLSELYEA
jgi:acyl carrier protein